MQTPFGIPPATETRDDMVVLRLLAHDTGARPSGRQIGQQQHGAPRRGETPDEEPANHERNEQPDDEHDAASQSSFALSRRHSAGGPCSHHASVAIYRT